ncbi:MAG: hypothetical protein ACREX8_14850 [Gammaproteobacteria bacterium]
MNDSRVPQTAAAKEAREMPDETPIACTLAVDDRPVRIAAARELGERALVGVDVQDRRALLRFDGERERVEELVAAESECCAFFEFAPTADDEKTELVILAPEGAEPLLRGLVAAIVAGWEGGLR